MSEAGEMRNYERDLRVAMTGIPMSSQLASLHARVSNETDKIKCDLLYGHIYKRLWYGTDKQYVSRASVDGPPPAIYKAEKDGLYLLEREGSFRVYSVE